MPLVSAKCTNCGATLKIDGSKEAIICQFCGSPFIVEKAIANYNTTNNITNNIQAGVVNMVNPARHEFEIVGGRLVKYRGESTNVSIPDTVIAIADDAFKDSAVESVVIPGSVRLANGFNESEYLTSVIIENGVKEIGSCAFFGCKNLSILSIPPTVTKISDRAFSCCTSLQSVDFSDGLIEIGDSAFSYCKSIKRIDLPESVTRLGHCAFAFCDSLFEIIIRGTIENQHYDIDYLGRPDAYEYPFESNYKLFEFYKEAKTNGLNCERFIQKVSTRPANEFIFEHSLWGRIKDFETGSNQPLGQNSNQYNSANGANRSQLNDLEIEKVNYTVSDDENSNPDVEDSVPQKRRSFFKRLKDPVSSLEEAKEIKRENTAYFLIFMALFLISVGAICAFTLLDRYPILVKIYTFLAFLGMVGMGIFGVISYLIRTVMKRMKNLTCDKCGSKLKNDENTTWKELSKAWIDNNNATSTLWITVKIGCTCPACQSKKSFTVRLSSGQISVTDHSLSSTLTTTQSVVDDYFNGIIHK